MTNSLPCDAAPSTLAEALITSAATDRAVTYVLSSREERRLPYAALLDRARRWLGVLQDRGVREGDELVLATDDQELFTAVFWACLLGRIVVVPVSPPTNDEGALKILNMLDVLTGPWLLSDRPLDSRLAGVGGSAARRRWRASPGAPSPPPRRRRRGVTAIRPACHPMTSR